MSAVERRLDPSQIQTLKERADFCKKHDNNCINSRFQTFHWQRINARQSKLETRKTVDLVKEELRKIYSSNPAFFEDNYKTYYCRHVTNRGYCRNGPNCKFVHTIVFKRAMNEFLREIGNRPAESPSSFREESPLLFRPISAPLPSPVPAPSPARSPDSIESAPDPSIDPEFSGKRLPNNPRGPISPAPYRPSNQTAFNYTSFGKPAGADVIIPTASTTIASRLGPPLKPLSPHELSALLLNIRLAAARRNQG